MNELIITISFATSLISLMILRPLAVRFNLVDFPTDRKDHTGNIPLVGGICVFFGVLLPYVIIIEQNKFCSMLLFFSSLILIHGVWDDYKNLQANTKMAFQTIITAIMIYITDVKLDSLGYLFGLSYFVELGILSIPVTIIAVIGLTNAINMIDGLDGFASSFVLIAILGLFCFGLNSYFSSFNSLLLVIVAALVPFMIFNITSHIKTKVFLGDGGSLFLGFILSWVLIYSAEKINNFNPSFALWCVAIPLFDFFTVIILRLVEKKPIMIANKDHIHHYLQNVGFSKNLILLITISSGFLLLGIGMLIEYNMPSLSFPVFLMLFLFYLLIRVNYQQSKKQENQAQKF